MKNLLLVATGVILLIGAGIWYTMFASEQMENQPAEISNQEVSSNNANETNTISNNLMGLIGLGQNLQCDFEYNDGNTSVSGTVYVSNDNMRGDFLTMVDGPSNDMSMIRNGDEMYVWGSALPEGIKMKFDPEKGFDGYSTGQDQDADNTSTSFDPNQDVDYRCSPWVPNSGMFTPPSNIDFRDMTALMESIQQQNPNTMMQAQCATCETLQGESKAMCLQQLKCN